MASMRKAKQITPSQRIRKALLYFSIVSVTCGWLASPALAHDFWIEPDQFTPQAGSRIDVRLREGMELKGNTLPYIEDWIQDFSAVTNGGRASVSSLKTSAYRSRNSPTVIRLSAAISFPTFSSMCLSWIRGLVDR